MSNVSDGRRGQASQVSRHWKHSVSFFTNANLLFWSQRHSRTFVLRSIIDFVQQDASSGAKPGMEDDKQFWRELFPPQPLNTAAAQGARYQAPAPMGLAGNAVPPNAAGWVMPPYVSALQLPVEWAHYPNELLRRGAQPRMIHQLRLTYTRDTGICGYAGGAHVHLGWVIPPDLRSDNPPIEWDTYIQVCPSSRFISLALAIRDVL